MTPYELARLRFWFDSYVTSLEDRGYNTASKVARMAFDSFLAWMEN